jgi:chromosome segregation ATPase
MSNALIVVACVAGGSMLLFAALWRRAEATASVLRDERTKLAETQAQLERDLAREEKARKRQAEELARLRKKADKDRKREARPVAQPLGTVARVRDLEAALARVERERDRALAQGEQAAGELARLRADLARASEREREAAALRPSSASEAPDPAAVLEARLAESLERLAKLEEELVGARRTEARMRKRVANQEQLYAALRGELEAKKDRLKTQEEQLERLRALKVSVID